MTGNLETVREVQHQPCGGNLEELVGQLLSSADFPKMKESTPFPNSLPELSEVWKVCPLTTRRNLHSASRCRHVRRSRHSQLSRTIQSRVVTVVEHRCYRDDGHQPLRDILAKVPHSVLQEFVPEAFNCWADGCVACAVSSIHIMRFSALRAVASDVEAKLTVDHSVDAFLQSDIRHSCLGK